MRKLYVLWLSSLVLVAVFASALTFAQTSRTEPQILSGGDIGVRIDGTDPWGAPIGTVVVRLYGQWVELSSHPIPRPLVK
jgi:hypothetical protein